MRKIASNGIKKGMTENTFKPIQNHPEYLSVINERSLLSEQVKSLQEENQQLKHDIELFKKALFGKKSEKLVPEEPTSTQQKLFPTDIDSRPEVENDETVDVKPDKRKKRKRYKDNKGNPTEFPPDLLRKEIVLKPEGDGKCEHCGKDKVEISEKVTERLCEIPAKFYVKRFVRPVLGCKCGKCAPVNYPAPYGVLPKSYLDISFLASMLVKKFAWHLPFYRQSQMLKELGMDIHRDVLIHSAIKLGNLLSQIVFEMLRDIKLNSLVQMDESPLRVAIRDGTGKKKYKQAYFWPILAGKEVVFIYAPDRRHCHVEEILGKDFKGILLSDGYKAYENYCKSNPETSLALCWDHARRRFYEIKDEEPLAVEALLQIKKLYNIEADIKELIAEKKLRPDKIAKYRKQHALPVLNDFKDWLKTVIDAPEVLPKSYLMEACSYALTHWSGLNLYLNYGNVPISNITVEQQIRHLKLGSKNWLLAASETGAKTIAVMNSLVCSCKMNGINCLEYFTDILGRLESDSAKKLTPKNWQPQKQTNS